MQMNSFAPRQPALASLLLGLALCLFTGAGCGSSDYQAVIVTIDASQFSNPRLYEWVIAGTLGTKPATEEKGLAGAQRKFTLLVAPDLTGTLQIQVEGQSIYQEPLARGTANVTLAGTSSEQSLTLLVQPVVADPAALAFTGTTFNSGAVTLPLLSGDVNGDTIPDLIAGEVMGTGVNVYLGDGKGGFGAALLTLAGQNLRTAALGDLDRDGAPDLIVVDIESGLTSLLPGLKNGKFGAAKSLVSLGGSASVVGVVDLNGDKLLDVVLSNTRGPTVLFGQKGGPIAGLFAQRRDVPLSDEVFVNAVRLGDLDEDGFYDLLVNYEGGVRVLWGKGDGTFLDGGAFPGLTSMASLATVSNRDVAQAEGGTLRLLAGKGDRTFAAPTAVAGLRGVLTLRTEDVNGDNKPDLLTTDGSGQNVGVVLANGDGTFAAALNFSLIYTTLEATTIDADGDTKPDLVVMVQNNQQQTQLLLLRNIGR